MDVIPAIEAAGKYHGGVVKQTSKHHYINFQTKESAEKLLKDSGKTTVSRKEPSLHIKSL